MKFSTALPGVHGYPPLVQDWEAAMGPADFQLVARTADDLGFDSIAVPEHIVLPADDVEVMGASWPHAFTAMAFMAGATSRITVDSNVLVLPYHHPVVLAKAVSTLDVLSGGRVRVSIGVGQFEGEFVALGVPFHERGRMSDEYLAAMIELWTSEAPTFEGRHVSFDGIAFEPKPVQQPHPPIWIGGSSDAAMRRAARHDGWLPSPLVGFDLRAALDLIGELREATGRTGPFDVAMSVVKLAVGEDHRPLAGGPPVPMSTQAVIDGIGELAETGVTATSVPTRRTPSLAAHLEHLHWFADEVMPAVR